MASTLTKRKKIGYAFGIFTESLIYNMFYTYYLTFLNEIVGISPKYSSIVIFISIAGTQLPTRLSEIILTEAESTSERL